MQSLLRWSVENSAAASGSEQRPLSGSSQKLDPGVIDLILGKPDAVLMKEALEVAVDEGRDEDARLQALDDFEMLVEQIDNANDLAKLKMWEPLQDLLTSPSSSNDIKTQVLWIIGTAVQNNPSAQNAYLSLTPLSTLLSFLLPSVPSAKTRSKAVYALSGLLKHNSAAVRQMGEAGGWDVLKGALEDSDIIVRRKTAFLLNALLLPTTLAHASSTGSSEQSSRVSEPVHPNSHASMVADPTSFSTSELTKSALEQQGLLTTVVQSLVSPVPHGPDGEHEGDSEFEEKLLTVLYTYLTSCQGKIPPGQKDELITYLGELSRGVGGDAELAGKMGLTQQEFGAFKQAI